jgi:hypothetical protein
MFDFHDFKNIDIRSIIHRLSTDTVRCEKCGTIMSVYVGEGISSIIYECPACRFTTEIGYSFRRKFYRTHGYRRFVNNLTKYSSDVVKAYGVLGLNPGASLEDVNTAFRELSKKWHPDVNPSPEAEEKFKKINEAREILLKYLKK